MKVQRLVILATIICIIAGMMVSSYFENKAAEAPPISLVFFLTGTRRVTEDEARTHASKVFGVQFETDNEDAEDFITSFQVPEEGNTSNGPVETLMMQIDGQMYVINSFPVPYFEDNAAVAAQLNDNRLSKAVAEHKAWISVDFLTEPEDEKARSKVYRYIGAMMAELAGPDCLAIYSPELNQCNEYSESLLEKLRSYDPLALFNEPTFAPIVGVDADDPRMKAAVDEAHSRWPEFAKAFKGSKGTDMTFLVKARFAQGELAEFMWMQVTNITDSSIIGTLQNQPHQLTNVKEGETVTIALSDLNDWMYGNEDTAEGGFTMKAIREIQQDS